MDVAACTPAEPEESVRVEVSDQLFVGRNDICKDLPNRHTKAAHLSAQQPVLRRNGSPTFLEHTLMMSGVVESINDDSRNNGKENTQANGNERQAILPGIESIHSRESVRVGCKEGEKYGERKRRVQTEEEHDRFREQHVQRS